MSPENFDSIILQDIIEEALSDSPSTSSRSYGQLGFMETDIVSSIFQAIDKKLPNADVLEIIKDARVSINSTKNSLKITDLHTVTHNCRKCQFSSVVPSLPKWNVTNPDVLFIFETSYLDQQSSEFFISSLKEAGFSSANVCMSYLLRCPTRDVQQNYIDNCISYINNEIQIMNPKVVCPLGNTVLSSIFGDDLKIKDYKQKITWLGSWPIFPLYAIPYVLKSGEQAQASFKEDLAQLYHFCYKKGTASETYSSE